MRAATPLLFLLVSRAEAARSGPGAKLPPEHSPTFFAAALKHAARNAAHPVYVEPRPLRPGTSIQAISEADVLPGDEATARLRENVARASGYPLTDAVEDWKCVLSTGIGPPPGERPGGDSIWAQIRASETDSVRQRRQACRARGNYVSIAFGLPRAGDDPAHPERWRIRTFRMLLYGYEVVDLFLVSRPNGEWEVVSEQRLTGRFS